MYNYQPRNRLCDQFQCLPNLALTVSIGWGCTWGCPIYCVGNYWALEILEVAARLCKLVYYVNRCPL